MRQETPKLLNWASVLEPQALEQAAIAAEMPFVFPHIALMPDAHLGKGSTVGSVIPTRGALMPAAVGVDIGCGMQAAQTAFTREAFLDDLSYLQQIIHDTIPMGIGSRGENATFTSSADERIIRLHDIATFNYLQFCGNWELQLGTLGGGNHFIEFAYDEEDRVWITLHSGSRGVGNKTAVHHIKKAQELCQRWWIDLPDTDLAYFPQGTDEFDAYLRDLNWAQVYARLNRDEMMDRCLAAVAQWVGSDEGTIEVEERFDCHHNYTTQEHHWGTNLWITRKGAILARLGDVGLIPGSMGTPSYVVRGLGNAPSFQSAPHGAGRAMGRKAAFRTLDLAAQRELMTGIVWGDNEKLLDETPGAYKSIETVMADATDLVEIVHTLRPLLNIKGV